MIKLELSKEKAILLLKSIEVLNKTQGTSLADSAIMIETHNDIRSSLTLEDVHPTTPPGHGGGDKK